MPKMDGYEFFRATSNNPDWSAIPFIFVTAKSDPDEIRFGKKLGVDDYITKPYNEEDLLASIAGKLNRSKKNEKMRIALENRLLSTLKLEKSPSISDEELKKCIFLFLMIWDEILGPTLKCVYPEDRSPAYDLQRVGIQLFQTSVSLYGQSQYFDSQGVHLRIANIERDGFLYFDTISDAAVRGGERQMMLVVISPQMNYLETLRIEEILVDIMAFIKKGDEWDINRFYQRIVETLTNPLLE